MSRVALLVLLAVTATACAILDRAGPVARDSCHARRDTVRLVARESATFKVRTNWGDTACVTRR